MYHAKYGVECQLFMNGDFLRGSPIRHAGAGHRLYGGGVLIAQEGWSWVSD